MTKDWRDNNFLSCTYRLMSDYWYEPGLYDSECFEITDYSIPDFWVKKEIKYDEHYNYTYQGLENWFEGKLINDFFDYETEARERIYQDLEKYYGINIKFTNKHFEAEKEAQIKVILQYKKAYLLENTANKGFKLITRKNKIFNENDFNLTINKEYEVLCVHNSYWYKIINDKGKIQYHPKYNFKITYPEWMTPEYNRKK